MNSIEQVSEQVLEQVQLIEQPPFSLESIDSQIINCYLCQKRGIINPLVVKQQYVLLLKYISSNHQIKPVCEMHNVNPPPIGTPCNIEPKYYFNPENPRYYCDQMTPDEKFAESHTEEEIEQKRQIVQKLQQQEDEYQKKSGQFDDELQPHNYHLMSRLQLYQQARILDFNQEKQQIADKSVIAKWMSTKQDQQLAARSFPNVVCCEPKREPVRPLDETRTPYEDINYHLDILSEYGF